MNPETPEKSSAAWTDDAKFQFLLRIVAQLKEDGRPIKFEKINLPGRTPKSLRHMWAKINKQIAEFEAQENNGESSPAKTPRKRGPPKKKTLKGADLDDVGFDVKQEALKKRGIEDLDDEEPSTAIKRTKVKVEANETLWIQAERM